MARHVIVLEEEGCSPPSEWPAGIALDPTSLGDGQVSAWEMLCQGVVLWAQTGAKVSLEIFICIAGDELVVPPDRNSLARLLRKARDYSWGAKLFLVASQRLRVEKLAWDGKESRERWMRTALEEKVLDILQVDYDPKRPDRIRKEDLRSAADDAYARHEALAVLATAGGKWHCLVSSEQKLLQSLLSRWTEVPCSDSPLNLLIIVDDLRPSKQFATVKAALRHYPGGRFLVVSLHPAPELRGFCQALKLPALIELRGPLELWYFLLRLNEVRQSFQLELGRSSIR